MAKLKKYSDSLYVFTCPGCGYDHPFYIVPQSRENRPDGTPAPLWQWNGSMDKPTFTPSLLCNKDFPESRCHLFMTDGKIQFLNDCFHSLAGRTVEIPEWE
jgi:hypothetical protein